MWAIIFFLEPTRRLQVAYATTIRGAKLQSFCLRSHARLCLRDFSLRQIFELGNGSGKTKNGWSFATSKFQEFCLIIPIIQMVFWCILWWIPDFSPISSNLCNLVWTFKYLRNHHPAWLFAVFVGIILPIYARFIIVAIGIPINQSVSWQPLGKPCGRAVKLLVGFPVVKSHDQLKGAVLFGNVRRSPKICQEIDQHLRSDQGGHWFPLIRPYYGLISWGGFALGGIPLDSHDIMIPWLDIQQLPGNYQGTGPASEEALPVAMKTPAPTVTPRPKPTTSLVLRYHGNP